ncbi:hypothetical protein LCGC14_1815580 [marine sediment metagenome]|uniref:Uncharacterized protein n=1 Tax=marine sediment metagenome TaxID=412755 RepID=A0A0F9J0B1_9ZZZZ
MITESEKEEYRVIMRELYKHLRVPPLKASHISGLTMGAIHVFLILHPKVCGSDLQHAIDDRPRADLN